MQRKDYDQRRRLTAHQAALSQRKKEKGNPEGICELCADVTCQFNITAKSVLKALEVDGPSGENVKQFTCDDREEDLLITDDLQQL